MSVLESASTTAHSDAGLDDVPSQGEEELPRVVIVEGGFTDPIDDLLLAIATGDGEAFVALEDRVGGLVRANIRRVLHDASRCETATREFFAEVRRDASDFDPDRDSAQGWLLTRAHRRAMSELPSGQVARC